MERKPIEPPLVFAADSFHGRLQVTYAATVANPDGAGWRGPKPTIDFDASLST